MNKTGSSMAAESSTESCAISKATVRGKVPSMTSESLLGEHGELKIQHNGELYSLRRTRQGKLILTK